MIARTIQGVVRDGAIQIQGDLGIPNGQAVEIVVRVVDPPASWGEGLRRCAGGMEAFWTGEDDRILEEIQRERQRVTETI